MRQIPYRLRNEATDSRETSRLSKTMSRTTELQNAGPAHVIPIKVQQEYQF